MLQNTEFYKGETETEYTVEGSIISCNYGYNLTRIGIMKDHAIYDNNGNAVLTCGDCMADSNIYNFGLCGSPILDENSEKTIIERGVPFATGQKIMGYKCKMQLAPGWQTGKVHTHIWNEEKKQYELALPQDGVLPCMYGAGIIKIEEVNKKQAGKDYFVIIRRGTISIRESNSKSSNSLKSLSPGDAIKVVTPIQEAGNEGITWIKVYVDKELRDTGWIDKSLIYPDEIIETKYLNNPEINFRSVTGIFNGVSRTEDYIKTWGGAGKGKYDKGQQKDQNGRFLVAVAPKVIYPDYPDDWGIQTDDLNAFSKNITVRLRRKGTLGIPGTSDCKDLLCVVKDIKAHSYNKYPDGHNNTVLPSSTTGKIIDVPNGYIQTGIAYPKSDNAKQDLACSIDHMNGTIVEFCGWEVKDFTISDYELVSIFSNETKHPYK